MTIFLCDDTMEGIFTAVYDAWASRLGHANVKLQVRGGTMELFADYRETETDMEKAEKVARTIKRELGEEGWERSAVRRWRFAKNVRMRSTAYWCLHCPKAESEREQIFWHRFKIRLSVS